MTESEAGVTAVVLAVVEEVVAEVRAVSGPDEIGLASRFDRDLGLDSLALVEVLARLEERLGVVLRDDALSLIECPADLVDLVIAAPRGASPGPLAPMPPGRNMSPPAKRSTEAASTIVEMLDAYVETDPHRVHLRTVIEGRDEPMSYADLRRQAGRVAGGLSAQGVRPGDRVALMLPTSPEYFAVFLGALVAGATPVPIYPPTRRSQIEDHLRRHARILDNAGAVTLVTVPEAKRLGQTLRGLAPTIRSVLTPAEVLISDEPEPRATVGARDLALIQYTSGSTGVPKGVALTHANLLANIRAMGQASKVSPADVFVSWLPLYHDMGLIGAWLGSLCLGIPLVVMSPTMFLTHPARWLRTISEVGGTISASPNFGYELCLAKISDAELDGLDLSSWRLAFNGAEPVHPDTVERFATRFAPFGFQRHAMTPVYGLAESSVGLAFPPLDRGPVIDRIRRTPFEVNGTAVPATSDEPDPLRFVACGRPLPGHDIEIVDKMGQRVEDRVEGRIRFRGPSAMSEYFRAPEATAAVIADGWIDTGDLGYLVDDELYVTGRVKDLVIRAGRNLHPEELEAAVGDIPGVRKGRVAVFGSTDPASGTERLVVSAETDETRDARRQAIRHAIISIAVDLLGSPPDDVVLAPRGSLLKTSSGKLRRSASREVYERGGGAPSSRPVWWQLARVRAAAGWSPAFAAIRRVLERRRSWRAWAALAIVGPPAWLLVVSLPSPRSRWAAARGAGRLMARLSGMAVATRGLDSLPALGPFVVVANHASYLDAIVLFLFLPGTYRFVAASELSGHLPLRVLFRRLDVVSVEREDRSRSVAASDQMIELARSGERLVVFPEARLSAVPGVRPFHLGAFMVAATVGCPVIPIGLRGTRAALAPRTWRVRPGPVELDIGPPLHPVGKGWAPTIRLRDAARASVLARCDEQDLAPSALHDPDGGGDVHGRESPGGQDGGLRR